MNNTIPKIRKSEKYPFDDLKQNKSFTVGLYSTRLAQHIGSLIGYYNRTRTEKRFVQRKVKGKVLVFREK